MRITRSDSPHRLAPHLTASLAALALAAGCGNIEAPPPGPSPENVHEVTGTVQAWPGEAVSSCGERLTVSRFYDQVGSRANLETRALITTPQAYQEYFGHPAPAGVNLGREWVVFYSAGRKAGGSTADVSVVGARGDVLHVVTTLTGPIPPCAPPPPNYPVPAMDGGAAGSSGSGTPPNTGGASGTAGSTGSGTATPGQTAPANPAPDSPPNTAGAPVTVPAPAPLPPPPDAKRPGPLTTYVLVKFPAQKTHSVDFQHQDINQGCNVDPVGPRCTSSEQCGKGQRCSTERGDCQGCGAGPGVACPAICFGVCEPVAPTNPCAAILCGPNQTCVVLESYPPQARCVPTTDPGVCTGGALMAACRSEESLKEEATKICLEQKLTLTDFGVGNACFAGGFAAAKYTCCSRPTPPPPPPAVCKADSDCALSTSLCGQNPCTCTAYAINQPQDTCAVPAIACLVNPCADVVAACDAGQCIMRPTKAVPPLPPACEWSYLGGSCQSYDAWKATVSATCQASGKQLSQVHTGSSCAGGNFTEVKFECCPATR